MSNTAEVQEEEKVLGPSSLFQENILTSNAKVMVLGGAVGSSKTYIGLMRHLRWVHDANYVGYCIRKNSSTIMKGGGLWDEACEMYRIFEPNIICRKGDKTIQFPSGATITFSHYGLREDRELYRGLQISGVFYDEATDAAEEDIWWLYSRLRSKADCPHSIWLSCNPDPDSYLCKWVTPWLLPKGHEFAGRKDQALNGKIRYFHRVNGELVFGDSIRDIRKEYGAKVNPQSFQVLLGTIDDNPDLMEMRPDYKESLEQLGPIDRERLLYGNWFSRPSNSGHFKREWFHEASEEPPQSEIVKTVRAYDFAGTLKSDSTPNPDYSASVKMSLLKNGNYFIHEVERFRMRYANLIMHVLINAEKDGRYVDIHIPEDPNAAAKATAQLMINQITAAGYSGYRAKTNRDKLSRFRPFAATASNESVEILRGCCICREDGIVNDNTWYYNELERFTGVRDRSYDGHDDATDATSDAFMALAVMIDLPSNFLKGLAGLKLTEPSAFDFIKRR